LLLKPYNLDVKTGGLIGKGICYFLEGRLSWFGSLILLLGIFMIALLMATPLTLESTWDGIIAKIKSVWERVLGFFNGGDEEADDDEAEQLYVKKPPEVSEPKLRKKDKPVQPVGLPEPVIKKQTPKEPINQPLKQLSLAEGGRYALPPLTLLDTYETETDKPDRKRLEQDAAILKKSSPTSECRERWSA
jgi:DNA segregation ATPase FtsK/SpoIIIE, S-DNA-T family